MWLLSFLSIGLHLTLEEEMSAVVFRFPVLGEEAPPSLTGY
jgi:hypothetical protein